MSSLSLWLQHNKTIVCRGDLTWRPFEYKTACGNGWELSISPLWAVRTGVCRRAAVFAGKTGGGGGRSVCVLRRGGWGQKTTYNPPSSLRGRTSTLSKGEKWCDQVWCRKGGGVCCWCLNPSPLLSTDHQRIHRQTPSLVRSSRADWCRSGVSLDNVKQISHSISYTSYVLQEYSYFPYKQTQNMGMNTSVKMENLNMSLLLQ